MPFSAQNSSSEIGWYLKGLDPKKHVTLELGGNAGVIVHSDADLDWAAQRIAFGGYYQAGQSCISVQRIFVQSEVYDDFVARLVKQVESLKTGDPKKERAFTSQKHRDREAERQDQGHVIVFPADGIQEAGQDREGRKRQVDAAGVARHAAHQPGERPDE